MECVGGLCRWSVWVDCVGGVCGWSLWAECVECGMCGWSVGGVCGEIVGVWMWSVKRSFGV